MRVRIAESLDDLVADNSDLRDFTAAQEEEGLTRPDWWFVAEDDAGTRLGRLALRRQYTCDEALRGTLPEYELFVFGIDAPWTNDPVPVLGRLAEAASGVGRIAWRFGTYHDDAPAKAAAAEAVGLELFQEKVGYVWEDSGGPLAAPTLTYRSIDAVGDEGYADILSRVIEGGVDREAAWYAGQMPLGAWGKVMVDFCAPEDRASWLVAYDQDELVGQVAITSFDPVYGDGTIAWVGVLPEQQGRGLGVELVRQAQRSARERGFRSLLSDTDTLNGAMRKTFSRTDHCDAGWHVWHYRWG